MERNGIANMLHVCELWQLNQQDIVEIEKVQKIMVRIIQGLLPGTSGFTARGLLGVFSIKWIKANRVFTGGLIYINES